MDEDFYLNLIIKRLNNALVPEESQQLETWEAASEDNRLFVAETEEAWKAATVLQSQPEVDLDQEFSFLEARMDESDLNETPPADNAPTPPNPQPLRKSKRPRTIYLVAGIAASLLLLILISTNYIPLGFFSGNGGPSGELQTVAAVNEMKQVKLPDGSTASIYPGSELQFPGTFAQNDRRVILKGEGFFEVEKDRQRPFVVETEEAVVTVLGTRFNVRTKPEAKEVTVQVLEGRVELSPRASKEGLYLEKGEAGIWNGQQQTLQTATPSPNELSWYTRKLVFEEVLLKDALPDIENLYQVRLEIENPALGNCTLTNTFDHQSLDEVLNELSTIFGLQALPKGQNRYTLSGGQC